MTQQIIELSLENLKTDNFLLFTSFHKSTQGSHLIRHENISSAALKQKNLLMFIFLLLKKLDS